MPLLIIDEGTTGRLVRRRQEWEIDGRDEVWDGAYIVSPGANDEHQDIAAMLVAAFVAAIRYPGLGFVRSPINVSDREDGWEWNYREPDVAVFLAGTAARNLGTHWVGGPDFAVEILSRSERPQAKLEFYARIGVREILIVGRSPWSLELYRLGGGALTSVGKVAPGDAAILASDVLPLRFRLDAGEPRPTIEVIHRDGHHHWTA